VDVCPENALITIRQDEAVVERLRRNWAFWETLPDTSDRYVNVSNVDEGIGVLSSLLLKKKTYRSMVGGDGACMGCGEKTAVHLVTSTIEALMQPRVKRFVGRLDELIEQLDARGRDLLSADADLDVVALDGAAQVDVPLDAEKKEELKRIVATLKALRDLKWRYEDGPSGEGRASLAITNSTGCSSVWGSTYPYNPYPYPWANHLFQDAPSLAIGVFEGHMRKMADAFVAVRRAELILNGQYDAARDEPYFTAFDYREFTDEEFKLCPPIMAIGGDGAMLDIGFQNLSRLLASGKPIRVMVLDTQVYSNTGGQACTSGFTGQVADMSAYGKAQHGKTETRKELALIALAHRGAFVHQSSQANASHLIAGVIKGLNSRRPAVFNIYTPCPVEHGLPDEWAPHGAKLALESRAFPFLTYDPDGGASIAECLSLDGNPAMDEPWPVYELTFVDDEGEERTMELPLTTADWAATEGRFRKHFKVVKPDAWTDDMVPFHEFVPMSREEREGKAPFIHALGKDRQLVRKSVSLEMVALAEDRLLFWGQLRELAGLAAPLVVRDAVRDQLEAEFDSRAEALRAEYEGRMAELKAAYPPLIARRMAEGLLKAGGGDRTVAELLDVAARTPGLRPIRLADLAPELAAEAAPSGNGGGVAVAEARPSVEASAAPAAAPGAVAEPADDGLAMEPYIDTARCTTCNECTNLNSRMFAYNEDKQAYIKDAGAGTFAELVQAAERCPAALIHPGTPLNPREKDLEKWLERAEPFN
jgi:pyruvate-ferredoxin/flavodoxin oxidoreductase